MWPVSDRFLDALGHTHNRVTRVDVTRGGALLESDVPITGGTVTVDESSQVRRTLSLDVGDVALNPVDTASLLAPFGTELVVRSGVRFPEGDEELVPVGVFRIDETNQGSAFAAVGITGSDRAKEIAEARLLVPWNVPAGRTILEEITRVIDYVDNSWEIVDLTGANEYTTSATVERERWELLELLASSIGAELFFDQTGVLILRDVPNHADSEDVVWTVRPGEGGVLGDVSSGLSREGIYNGVVATNETDTGARPIVAFAFQKSGPFRWGGDFGRVPRFYSSPFVRTVEQARKAAAAVLARSTGYAQQIDPEVVANPALDVGDTIQVELPNGDVHYQIVHRLAVPLGSETAGMRIETRDRAEADFSDDSGSLS